jgi:hypothetical protein
LVWHSTFLPIPCLSFDFLRRQGTGILQQWYHYCVGSSKWVS